MDELERAKQALFAADAAGDTEAAQALAQFIRSQQVAAQSQDEVEEAPQQGFLGTAADVAGKGLDLAAAGIESATFGLLPSYAAGLQKGAAEVVEAFGGREAPTFQELRDQIRAPSRRAREEMPILATAADIAGGVATGKGIYDVGRRALQAAPLLARGGEAVSRVAPRLSRLAGGAASGAASGGLYAGGTQEFTPEVVEEGAKFGALGGFLAPAVGAAASPLTQRAQRAFGLAPKLQTPKNAGELLSESSALYAQIDDAAGAIKPGALNRFINKAQGLRPKSVEAQKFKGKPDTFEQTLDDLTRLQDDALTIRGATEVDQELSRRISSEFKPNGLSPEGVKMQKLQEQFRDFFMNSKSSDYLGGQEGFQSVRRAMDLWKQGRKTEDIQNILERASRTQQPASSVRRQLASILGSKKKRQGYDDETLAIMDSIAKANTFSDMLNTAGSRLLGIGAALTAGPTAGALTAAGSAGARGASEALVERQMEDVLRSVQGLSPRSIPLSPEARTMLSIVGGQQGSRLAE